MVCLFGLDALAFRTRRYTALLQPESSTGTFEFVLWREQRAQAANGDNLVATIGDSRFAYSPKQANQLTGQTGYVFRHAGVAGTDVRSWYYMLRDLDPSASRYRAIVFGVDDYDDEDEGFDHDDDIRALHYCAVRLRLSDALSFALSFHSPAVRFEALRGAMLKGFALQSDLQEFLADPKKRIRQIKLYRWGYEIWTYDFIETDRTMTGIAVDWPTLRVTGWPKDADQNTRDTVYGYLVRPPVSQTGRMTAFRRDWFGRILGRYRGSRTKIIFIRLPRGPLVRPAYLKRKSGSTIRGFASLPNVRLYNEHAFDSLERPELFKDAMHLNRYGIAKFSPMLAQGIAAMLGPPR